MATTTNYGWTTPNDTDLVRNGASAIRSLGSAIDTTVFNNANAAVQKTLVDAKGDLVTATANDTPARLAVGNNGETLVADSSQSTGLRWNPTGVGNYIINGNFDWWQRGTSFTSGYTADRWTFNGVSNVTAAQESTTIQDGSTYSMKLTSTNNSSYGNLIQAFEAQTVNELCGKTITASVYVRANATFNTTVGLLIATGTTANTATGGTWTTQATANGTPSTSGWTRLTASYTVPTGTKGLRIELVYNALVPNGSILYWSQAQLEVGSTATQFKRAGGTLAGELAACQRYYWRANADSAYTSFGNGYASSATAGYFIVQNPVMMRVQPTSFEVNDLAAHNPGASISDFTAFTGTDLGRFANIIQGTGATGLTANRPYFLSSGTNTASYIGFSAEL